MVGDGWGDGSWRSDWEEQIIDFLWELDGRLLFRRRMLSKLLELLRLVKQ